MHESSPTTSNNNNSSRSTTGTTQFRPSASSNSPPLPGHPIGNYEGDYILGRDLPTSSRRSSNCTTRASRRTCVEGNDEDDLLELKPDYFERQLELLNRLYDTNSEDETLSRGSGGRSKKNEQNKMQDEDPTTESDSVLIVPSSYSNRRMSVSANSSRRFSASGCVEIPLWAWYNIPSIHKAHSVGANSSSLHYPNIGNKRSRASFIAPLLPLSTPPSPVRDQSFQDAIRQRLFLGEDSQRLIAVYDFFI